MRKVRAVLFAGGIAVLIWLVLRIGPGVITESLARVSWTGLALVCLAHGLAMVADTLGWRYAFRRDRVPLLTLFTARTAGEAINLVTAVASVGGEAVKAWLIRRDASYEESVPSVIIAKTSAVMAQAVFLLFGIAVALTAVTTESRFLTSMLWLLLAEALAVAGFLAVQVTGALARMGRLLAMLNVTEAEGYAARLTDALREYYRQQWRRFVASIGWHLAGCLLSIVETWLIMRAVGLDASPAIATVVDALGSGIRFASFLVPASLGTLESANAAAFDALGYGAAAGLAYSLVRRGRQIVWVAIGIVTLLAMRATSAVADHDGSASRDPVAERQLER